MKIQSLSVVVPNRGCANKCPFCVSRMVNSDIYPNKMDINDPHYDINVREYMKRLRYVANLGCGIFVMRMLLVYYCLAMARKIQQMRQIDVM